TPVGGVIALVGIAYVALIGWRLIPERADTMTTEEDGGLYVAEARVKDGGKADGEIVNELYALASEHEIIVLGVVRNHKRLPGFSRDIELRKGDFLVLEGDPKQIETFIGAAGLEVAGTEKQEGLLGKSLMLIECIVPDDARIIGRSDMDLRLLYRHGVTIAGVSRQGKRFRDRVRKLPIKRGDTLLLIGREENLIAATAWLGVYTLADRHLDVIQRNKALAAIGAFGLAVLLSVIGVTSLAVSLGLCVVAYLALGLIGRDFYEMVDWKIIVLLACLIPLGTALETSGGTQLIAQAIVDQTLGAPAWVILAVVMLITMTLSDFLNNVATALIAAPIAVSVAKAIDVSPDPFLMGVAVAASCAFLTPIGHKNNTIIMGPGNYRFGDYWRMGLILEVIVLVVAVPMLTIVWPFHP
ncbi:MAG: SLC13 family permease, partial [Deltaproteobacteria bacterium]